MEEPKARPVGRPRRGAAKKPADVVWRMTYVACITFHDARSEALSTLHYGRMPAGGGKELARRLALDVEALLGQVPSLEGRGPA